MAKQQHAAQQKELQLFGELGRERRNTNNKCAQQAVSWLSCSSNNKFRFFFLPGRSDQSQTYRGQGKAFVVFYESSKTVFLLSHSKRTVDSGLICGY